MRGRTPPLADRLAALREAVEVADGRLEVPELAQARTLLAKAGAREALGDATVVALAGATGSGKSTLFNALSGSEVSTPGVRRPTTGVAHATVWGGNDDPTHPTDRLLDWLQVPRRHRHAPEPALDGLVLLDLPDHDSVRLEHRLEVDRLVQLVDVLVWVLDPEKYADAAVHERYLVPLAGHAGVLLVVLNQVDRLDPAAVRACLTDLRGLLDREGLADTPLLAVSGRTGTGLGELRADLARRVSARRAATDRLTADVRGVATALAAHCAAGSPAHGGSGVGRAEREQLTDALAEAAGVPAVTAAVERSVRRSGTAATGWPLVRWTRKLRPDPLERLHLGQGADDDGAVVARTSLPAAGAVQRAGVTRAVRAAREAAGEGLPEAWRDELRRTVEVSEERLADRLDQAVAGTDLGPQRTPLWQRAVGGLQWLLTLVALAGALWLLALVVLGFFQLDDVVPLPRVEGLPLPTLLLVGGLLAGALLALVARPLVGLRARRRARRAEQRLHAAVDVVAQEEVLAPMAEVREDHDRYCAAVTRARK
ncbi:GTP-binding protein EngB required for normal cell division [Geodermatophilus siccatus]|uniref:GTP-binding protein EngB required for normal cell division n=1 Tax=Geodermatophilus siccatus TaxID=1137991 RepID=A0A1G9WNK9_9ACTN|nr:GTPase [Geodermatophilus siccatus]SDM86080.1 GTP-binding protein EngB required for normal cell division [Geodermatophilus siccatus]